MNKEKQFWKIFKEQGNVIHCNECPYFNKVEKLEDLSNLGSEVGSEWWDGTCAKDGSAVDNLYLVNGEVGEGCPFFSKI